MFDRIAHRLSPYHLAEERFAGDPTPALRQRVDTELGGHPRQVRRAGFGPLVTRTGAPDGGEWPAVVVATAGLTASLGRQENDRALRQWWRSARCPL